MGMILPVITITGGHWSNIRTWSVVLDRRPFRSYSTTWGPVPTSSSSCVQGQTHELATLTRRCSLDSRGLAKSIEVLVKL